MKTVTLVLGGARSGKSRYAQELASAFHELSISLRQAAMKRQCLRSASCVTRQKGGDPHEASKESGDCIP